MQQKYEEEEYDLHYKIIFLGDSCVGKTALLQKYVGAIDADYYFPTPGIDQQIKLLDFFNKTIKLRIWDAGGDQNIRHLVKSYLPLTDGALICFDVTNSQSFDNAKTFVEWYRENKKLAPIILVGCKSNLVNQRLVSLKEAQKMAKDLGLTYLEIPVNELAKIENAVMEITQQIYFQTELNKIKPLLETHFKNYLKLYPKSNSSSMFRVSAPILKERLLKEEYEVLLNKLFLSTRPEELEEFCKNTLDLIDKVELLFKRENPMQSIVAKSPLAKALRQTLVDLYKIIKNVDILSHLQEMERLSTLTSIP